MRNLLRKLYCFFKRSTRVLNKRKKDEEINSVEKRYRTPEYLTMIYEINEVTIKIKISLKFNLLKLFFIHLNLGPNDIKIRKGIKKGTVSF